MSSELQISSAHWLGNSEHFVSIIFIFACSGGVAPEEKPSKETPPRGFRELKEALKILESLKNMTVEQLWTGSPTSPTAEPSATSAATTPADAKPTKEKRFLDDIKKLQENLKKTLDNVAIVEEDKMEAAIEEEKVTAPVQAEPQTPVRSEWPSDTPVLCQQSGGKPGVTFTSAKGEVFSVLEWAPGIDTSKPFFFLRNKRHLELLTAYVVPSHLNNI